MMNLVRMMVVVGCLAAPAVAADAGRTVALTYDARVPQLRFAAGEIVAAAMRRSIIVVERPGALGDALHFVLEVAGKGEPQSYAIRRTQAGPAATLRVIGADPAGAMYGGLDLAEAIRLGTIDTLGDSDHKPHITRRGIKFNIPLDARTPSYSDCSDAAQQNIPEMWSMDFWREMLDEMARQRFNVLTLWSLHPFPSMVKVPEYPDVALANVKRTTAKLDDTFDFTGKDMVRPAMLENLQTVKVMSIDEKIRFWRDVMQHAHDRGIEVYLFTWNIFVFGTEGKYGITAAQDNPVTIDYFRASVRQAVLTYPHLAGIGITAGEQMRDRKDEFGKEKWLWRTYGEGVRDALRQQPGREFRVIHRYHQTGLGQILAQWKDLPCTLDLSYKYAVAHMYASTAPPFARQALAEMPADRRVWMTVRNDDIYHFRWGDPAFAREFIGNLPGPDKLAGCYMGSDGYNWGREFLGRAERTPRELVMQKQWYSFMLWGRLSYEPTLGNDLFQRTLAERFPEVPAEALIETWSQASRIIPQVTRFFWGDIDLKWYPEACLSHPRHKGFYTLRHFVEGASMPGTGILSIGAWRQRVSEKKPVDGIAPLEVADRLDAMADAAHKGVAVMRPAAKGEELLLTLDDMEAMAHLGQYYAGKIRAAAEIALFDRDADPARQAAAVRHMEGALAHWKQYAAIAMRQYRPALYNRVGFVDFEALTEKVAQDVEMARGWKPAQGR